MEKTAFLLFMPMVACTLGPATEGDLAITNVTVLPMDTERTLSDQTVVIRAGRVVHLVPSASVRVAEEVVGGGLLLGGLELVFLVFGVEVFDVDGD